MTRTNQSTVTTPLRTEPSTGDTPNLASNNVVIDGKGRSGDQVHREILPRS